MTGARALLAAGGTLSATAALAHLGCIVGGPRWYRFFGAGERMAVAVERGQRWPAAVTLGIAGVLATWAAYAWSGAMLLRPLPLLRAGLVGITVIYMSRGLVLFFPGALRRPDLSPGFLFWSSLIVLGIGVVHAIGLAGAWTDLEGVT